MTNKILHTVTNRATFVSPVFPAETTFSPTTQLAVPTSVREFLQMPFNVHDYFVVGLLQAIDAVPELRWDFNETIRTYDLKHYQYPTTWQTGAELGPSMEGPPAVNRIADEWPVFFDIYADYVDAAHLRVYGGSHNEIVSATPNGDFVIVNWPSWTGISGTLQNLDPGWTSGFSFHLYAIPNNFPYENIAAALKERSDVYQLLTQQGLEAQLFSARTAMEKVATVALAVGLSHTKNV